MELVLLISNAITGVVTGLLTYLAARHRTLYNERALYVGAVHHVTQELREELLRIAQDRDRLRERVYELERTLDERRRLPDRPDVS